MFLALPVTAWSTRRVTIPSMESPPNPYAAPQSQSLYALFVVDGEGVGVAMKGSVALASGHGSAFFVFFLILGLMNVAGALLCGVGLLVTMLAVAIVYTRATGRLGPRP